MTPPDAGSSRYRPALSAARRAALGSVLGLAMAAPGTPALAQLLPQLGAPVELGDLRKTFQRAYGPIDAPVGERTWTITPGIDLETTLTDNVRGLGMATGGRGSEIVTTLTPSLSVSGAAPRLRGSLYFAPQLRSFMRNPQQNGVSPNLNASGRATIFEDLLFINASAYMTEYSRAGGFGPGTGNNLSRQDRVQSKGGSIGPLLRHSFADYGVAELSHTVSYMSQTGQALRSSTPFAPAVAPGVTITNNTQASFTSGQEFGRFNFTTSFSRINYNGPGVLKNAHRQNTTLDLGYALTRNVTLLGLIGHQDLQYGGTRKIQISGPIWNVGVRWAPDPDTSMTLRYGYRDGGASFNFEGSTAPTPRTRISANYSEGMANAADELQYMAGRAQLSPSGITIDPTTGMPVILTNNFAGAQGGLAQVRRYSVSGVLIQELDVFTVSLNRDERITLSGDAAGASPNTTYTAASVAWQRELSPGVRGNTQFSYGERVAAGFGGQETMTFSTGLTWSLSETLSTRATYTHARAASNRAGFGYRANLISLGVRKTF